jgi:NitT/TauT family transport system permease protein
MEHSGPITGSDGTFGWSMTRQPSPVSADGRAVRAREVWLGWFSFLMLIAVWQALALLLNSRFLPTPVAVAGHILWLTREGHLIPDFAITLLRAACGFVIAMGLGTAAGIALGRSRLADRLFLNWVVVGMNLPAIVIAILCYIWLGLNDTALILAVVLNKTPIVITNIRQGVLSFDPAYDEFALAYRLSRRDTFWRIHVPQLTPYLLTAARTGLSLVWKIVLVFEVLGADSGVGFRVSLFFQFFDLKGILAYTTVFVCIVMMLEHLAIGPLERRLLAWRADRE